MDPKFIQVLTSSGFQMTAAPCTLMMGQIPGRNPALMSMSSNSQLDQSTSLPPSSQPSCPLSLVGCCPQRAEDYKCKLKRKASWTVKWALKFTQDFLI